MAKGTVLFIFILSVIATLLLGINIGKKLGTSQPTLPSTPTPQISGTELSTTPSPSTLPIPSSATNPSISLIPNNAQDSSTISNGTCGFTITLPSTLVRQETQNTQSYIYADPNNPDVAIATTCAAELPRPPVLAGKIESITLSGVEGTLYHDENPDGTPRDEVIIKHPSRKLEIIIAGYGSMFQSALSSFQFVE